jgi:hypothetical protein
MYEQDGEFIPANRVDGYPADWDERRRKVYRRDGHRCRGCSGEGRLVAHHVVPKSQGGSHKMSNLVTLCEPCHAKVHPHLDSAVFDKVGEGLRELWSFAVAIVVVFGIVFAVAWVGACAAGDPCDVANPPEGCSNYP